MHDFLLARMLHVIGVVLWIGGVAMVTTVLLPAAKRLAIPAERIAFFARVQRFHWLLLVLSGVTIAGAVAGSHGGWG